MHIILEGPDGSGKTTIANALINKYGFKYHHSTSKTQNDLSYHIDLLLSSTPTVYDRFNIGEHIFPTLFGRESKMNMFSLVAIIRTIQTTNCVMVILYSSDVSILKKRLKIRGEDSKTLKLIDSINYMFQMFATSLLRGYDNVLAIDIASEDPLTKIEEYYLERKQQ